MWFVVQFQFMICHIIIRQFHKQYNHWFNQSDDKQKGECYNLCTLFAFTSDGNETGFYQLANIHLQQIKCHSSLYKSTEEIETHFLPGPTYSTLATVAQYEKCLVCHAISFTNWFLRSFWVFWKLTNVFFLLQNYILQVIWMWYSTLNYSLFIFHLWNC